MKLCNKYIYVYRLRLAALHYNENCNKDEAVTKAGTKRYSISFPKQKQGLHTVRKLKVTSTYSKCRVINHSILIFYSLYPRITKGIFRTGKRKQSGHVFFQG